MGEQRPPQILVVDDDAEVRLLFRLILEDSAYRVTEAQNGVAALLRIKVAVPDLVVTDIVMPIMNGEALIGRLRSNPVTARIPILAVTGAPEADVLAAKADAILRKPFDNSHLVATVSSLLSRPSGFSLTPSTSRL